MIADAKTPRVKGRIKLFKNFSIFFISQQAQVKCNHIFILRNIVIIIKIKKVAVNTYLITPYNVDLLGDLIDELENNGLYF